MIPFEIELFGSDPVLFQVHLDDLKEISLDAPVTKYFLPGSTKEIVEFLKEFEAVRIARMRAKKKDLFPGTKEWSIEEARRSLYPRVFKICKKLEESVPKDELEAWRALYREIRYTSQYLSYITNRFQELKPFLEEFATHRPAMRVYLHQLRAADQIQPWMEFLRNDENLILSVENAPKLRLYVFSCVIDNALVCIQQEKCKFPGVLPGTKAHWQAAAVLPEDTKAQLRYFELLCGADVDQVKKLNQLFIHASFAGLNIKDLAFQEKFSEVPSVKHLTSYMEYYLVCDNLGTFPRLHKPLKTMPLNRLFRHNLIRGLEWLSFVPGIWVLNLDEAASFEQMVYSKSQFPVRGYLPNEIFEALSHPRSEAAVVGYVESKCPALFLVYRLPDSNEINSFFLFGEYTMSKELSNRLQEILSGGIKNVTAFSGTH